MPPRFHDGLDPELKAILLQQIRDLWTHASTSLEGSALSLGDTAFILEEGLTVAGKPLADHEAAYGHAKAIDLVYRLLDAGRPLTAADLYSLHRAVLTERIADIFRPVGAWKREPNYTAYINSQGRQAVREYPSPRNIHELMGQWLGRLNRFSQATLSRDEALQAYANLHLSFVTIHPFYDGNGRMARLLANIPVLLSGWPPIVVPSVTRQLYKDTISRYQETIADLPAVRTLDSLPDNPERARFVAFCSQCWADTLALVEQVHQLQARRLAERTPPATPGPA